MNYARIRNKLKENQKKLSKMNGEDRTKLEEHIIAEASKEEEQTDLVPEASKEQEQPSLIPEVKKEEEKKPQGNNHNANRRK